MKTWSTFIKSIFIFFGLVLFSQVNSQASDSCTSNLDFLNSQLPFPTTSFNCNPVWSSQGFILRYKQTGPSEWSFLLSAPDPNSYVGMGFSPNGKMVGSSAIVGWMGSNGTPLMQRYFLGGQSPNEVVRGQGNLQLGNLSNIVIVSSRIYMAFQLINTDSPATRLIYSVGPSNQIPLAPDFRLTQHSEYTSTVLNYATGQTETKSSNTNSLRKTHGILVMLGWGILMAIGAIVARYMRQWDPIWFYSHAAIQSLGFILGVAGIICGFVLSNRVSTDVGKHKSLGIAILVLGCLQVIALLARPDKESKVRKYWNWYHYGVGRILILLAAVNVFYGIHIGKAGNGWNAGYAVVLVVLFIIAFIFELNDNPNVVFRFSR